MATNARNRLPPGVRFNPTHVDAVGYYLDGWITGAELNDIGTFIFRTDVYGAHPGELTAQFPQANETLGYWFFFSMFKWQNGGGKRVNRGVTGGGFWHSEQAKKLVRKNGSIIGYRQNFRYFITKYDKSPWLMEEYGSCLEDGNGKETVRVLCKIYLSPRRSDGKKRQTSEKSPSSSFQDGSKRVRLLAPHGCGGAAVPPPPRQLSDLYMCGEQDHYAEDAPSDQLTATVEELYSLLEWMEDKPPVPPTYGAGGVDESYLVGSIDATPGAAMIEAQATTFMLRDT